MIQETVQVQLTTMEQEMDEIIEGLMAWQRYVGDRLTEMAAGGAPPAPEFMQTLDMYARNASRLGRLLRDQRAIEGDGKDELARAVSRALDKLRAEYGWDV